MCHLVLVAFCMQELVFSDEFESPWCTDTPPPCSVLGCTESYTAVLHLIVLCVTVVAGAGVLR